MISAPSQQAGGSGGPTTGGDVIRLADRSDNPPLPPYFPVEPFTDQVVDRLGGCRVDTVLPPAHGKKNADYYFASERAVVELKELRKDHFGPQDHSRLADAFMWTVRKGLVPRSEHREWTRDPRRPLPSPVLDRMISLFRRSLKGPVRKAQHQIRETLNDLNLSDTGHGLLLIVNDNNFFLPMTAQVAVVTSILVRPEFVASPIEGIAYTSLNIGVHLPGSELDHNVWVPGYRDSPPAGEFASFVNRFGKEFQQLGYEMTPGSVPPIQTDDGAFLGDASYIYRSPSHSPSTLRDRPY